MNESYLSTEQLFVRIRQSCEKGFPKSRSTYPKYDSSTQTREDAKRYYLLTHRKLLTHSETGTSQKQQLFSAPPHNETLKFH